MTIIFSMIIGTRGSKLSLAQTKIVEGLINKMGIETEIRIVRTQGDKTRIPLWKSKGTGLFSSDINNLVLNGEIDIAVHSMKDLPVDLPEDLEISAIIERGNVEDVLISDHDLSDLPYKAKIGTSSLRRIAFLKFLREDIEIVNIRGNVDTRIRKMDDLGLDGIIVARAGIERLNIKRKFFVLPKDLFVPQANQGAIAVVSRKDSKYREFLKKIDDEKTRIECEVEREILRILNAGCHTAIGIYAWMKGDTINLHVARISDDFKIRKDLWLKSNEREKIYEEFKRLWFK